MQKVNKEANWFRKFEHEQTFDAENCVFLNNNHNNNNNNNLGKFCLVGVIFIFSMAFLGQIVLSLEIYTLFLPKVFASFALNSEYVVLS